MRNVILQEFVSLDGLAADQNSSVDFIPGATAGDQSFGQRQMNFIASLDAILLGRVTYQMFAGFWPNVTSGEDKPFADRLKLNPETRLLSDALQRPVGQIRACPDRENDAAQEIAKLKRASGKNMVIWGSISLGQSLLQAGCIDEIQLVLCPVVLGSGRTLFEGKVDPLQMKLVKAKSFDRGTVLLEYRTA